MSQALHPLERRAQMLGQRLKSRMADITESLQAAQGRVPFRTPLSQNKALDWWSVHRYDDLGQKALAGLQPLDVFNLDAALNQRTQEMQGQGMPVEGTPTPTPGDAGAALGGQGFGA